MKEINKLKNVEIDDILGCGLLKLNPEIYPLEIIFSAAYIMIDKAFIILDESPNKEILVEITRKDKKQDIKKLIEEFNEELLNYLTYKTQSKKNAKLREYILQRLIITNNPEIITKEENEDIKTK
jgi:His-Xaa-Ser system protein HxsD